MYVYIFKCCHLLLTCSLKSIQSHQKDAAKREVREETGLECEPTNLLMVESAQGHWFRYVFTGHVTGM